MTIYFGLGLDEELAIPDLQRQAGVLYLGQKRLLHSLEIQLGFQGYATDNAYLRVEQYRQVLTRHIQSNETVFYRASFEADQLATAAELLSRRDELVLAAWDFVADTNSPTRLQTLADLEQLLYIEGKAGSEDLVCLSAGFSDRFVQVTATIPHRHNAIECLYHLEPMDLLPPHLVRLFAALAAKGTQISQHVRPPVPAATTEHLSDLQQLQIRLSNGNSSTEKQSLQQDGSLLILRAKRETTAAAYLAKVLSKNTAFHPTLLITEKNRTLDNALIQEGLPSLGILSASLARPTLQILKLATAFLWAPLDPFKLMEFVTLSMKPLEEELASRIARQLSTTPGINSEGWHITINRYFEELEALAATDKNIQVTPIRQQYNFWFRRRRYASSTTVPKEEAIEIYNYLRLWAYEQFEQSANRNHSLLVLSEQAKRVQELLEAQPETQLSHLELERTIRTIYEPSPVLFRQQELDFFPYIHHPAAFIEPVLDLVWWNFIQTEPNHFFSRWYQAERAYLETQNIRLDTPKDENARLIWQRTQAILYASDRLILVAPAFIQGKAVHAHPLQSDLEATFGDLSSISLDIDDPSTHASFEQLLRLPKYKPLPMHLLGRPKPFLHIPNLVDYLQLDKETFTSLNTLFYYPYQWVFRYKARLQKSSILSVVKDTTLLGNLAHRFFEKILKEDISDWQQPQVNAWIDEKAPALFRQEGAALLMYGREPDKVHFLNRLKYSIWSLISSIQNNGWQVLDTEMDMQGTFVDVAVKAKADLILQRPDEFAVVDLKWRGIAYRRSMIKNEEDLQLVLYSKLLDPAEEWAHTAYFIIEKGLLIARNAEAFSEADTVQEDALHDTVNTLIHGRMEQTYHWRNTQVKKGFIEVRCANTHHLLEDAYDLHQLEQASMEMLEMKNTDASFDDYRTLINTIV